MLTCARWQFGVRQKVDRKEVVSTEVSSDGFEAQNLAYVWDNITRPAVLFRRPRGLVCAEGSRMLLALEWHWSGCSYLWLYSKEMWETLRA